MLERQIALGTNRRLRLEFAPPQSRAKERNMAGFKMHISTSTVVGIGYGAAGYLAFDEITLPAAAVSAGLCSIAGILPDLDSDSGKPVREVMAFSAAVIPMFMMDRLRSMGLSAESMVLAGGCVYIFIRFGLGEILKRYTVHRGMWHSIPAALTAAMIAALLVSGAAFEIRLFKVVAVPPWIPDASDA